SSPLCCLRHSSPDHPDLHSFPTRRSSDLLLQAVQRDAIVHRVEASRQVAHLLRPSASPDHPGVLPNLRLEPPHHALDELGKAERSEEHTSELQSRENLVCRLLLEKKKRNN